jgi:RNA polymerase sigma-70 factor (ECF subfamily)
MQLRAEKSHRRRHDLWEREQDSSVESYPEMHPIDEAGENLDEALEDCIERLKAEQKECIQLFYFQNWSYRQIAEILHMDEKKVKSHLQNAKRNLKICLEGKNGKRKEA